MSLSPDQKLPSLTQYKELAAKVGVARYGSKGDLVSRIKAVSGGKDKLNTLIDKTKKSLVVHKKKKNKAKAEKKNTEKNNAEKSVVCVDCDDDHSDDDSNVLLDFDEIVEHLTDRMRNKLAGHRTLVDKMLKVFDEEAVPEEIAKLSDKKAIKQLAIVMLEDSDDESEE